MHGIVGKSSSLAGVEPQGTRAKRHVKQLRHCCARNPSRTHKDRRRQVLQLHQHALKLCFRARNIQQVQDDGAVLAQHLATGNHEHQTVRNLRVA